MIPNPLKGIHLAVGEAIAAEICVVPPREDGTKAPEAISWKEYQEMPVPVEDLRKLYSNGRTGVGFVCGRVSGELECMDFDTPEMYGLFKQACGAAGLDEILERIETGYSERTPHGFHLLYRPVRAGGCKKLARRVEDDGSWQTLIEVKAGGGYIIVSPSFGTVNLDGPYVRASGSAATIARISMEDRDALHRVAMTFDTVPKLGEIPVCGPRNETGDRPGDDFIRRGSWDFLSTLARWKHVASGVDGFGQPQEYWRRPKKDKGNSAILHPGSGLFYVFSSTTWFPEVPAAYNKFRTLVYTCFTDEIGTPNWQAAREYVEGLGFAARKEEPAAAEPAEDAVVAAVEAPAMPPPVLSTWTPVRIVIAELEDEVAPPMFLARIGGALLFYEKELNYLFGGPGSLKTWIALAAAREKLLAGDLVAFFDFDRNRRVKLVRRLTGIGVPEKTIEENLLYACPNEPSGVKRGARAAEELVASFPTCGLVILDSVQNGARLDNLTMSNEDMAIWFRLSEAFIDAGSTIILVDHVTKNHEGRRTPIGAQHKLAAVGGTALRVELVQNPIILPGAERDGFSRTFVEKDRHGFLPTGYGECISVLKLGIRSGDPHRDLIVGLPADGPLEVEKKKTCMNCGTVWIPGHPKAKYCSDICRNKANRGSGSVSGKSDGE